MLLRMRPDFHYAYLHGFGGGTRSRKGTELRKRFSNLGLDLAIPNLNRPSFTELSVQAMLAAMDLLDAERKMESDQRWRLIGSSLGGWLAARWAMLNPDRVDRLLLLCPGFDLAARWPVLLGPSAFEAWRTTGRHLFPDPTGELVPVNFSFYESCRADVGTPEVFCPTVIVHGMRDEIVPFESSRLYSKERTHVDLVAVDDDHNLANSLDSIEAAAHRIFT